MNQNYFQVL